VFRRILDIAASALLFGFVACSDEREREQFVFYSFSQLCLA
jgi:hypothetical protein